MRKSYKFMIIFLFFFLVSCTTVDPSNVTIELNEGIDTVEINTSFIDMGAKSKAYGFTVENEVISTTVDTTTLGTYEIVYQVSYKDVIKQITRMVIVIDETAPTGTINSGIDTVFVGDDWTDQGVTSTDNSLEDVQVSVTGHVLTEYPGEYIIEYHLSDSSGNESILYRYVNVIEIDD